MPDVFATLVRLKQFIFEYSPFFLASWLGFALVIGLITVIQSKVNPQLMSTLASIKYLHWPLRSLVFLCWSPSRKMPHLVSLTWQHFFSLTSPLSALVVTCLIGMEFIWLRLGITAIFAFALSWLSRKIILPELKTTKEELSKLVLSLNMNSMPYSDGLRFFARISWENFIRYFERTLTPFIIGSILASVIIIYVPAYVLFPWFGEEAWYGPYLFGLLSMPFQLTGGTEVFLASALLVKGASLGTVSSVLLVSPITSVSIIRRLYQPASFKSATLHLITVWVVIGSLGAAVNFVQYLTE